MDGYPGSHRRDRAHACPSDRACPMIRIAAGHLGLGKTFVAEFGPRGEFMIELYPLETRSGCVERARDLAESAVQ